jgi:hypothetical protein
MATTGLWPTPTLGLEKKLVAGLPGPHLLYMGYLPYLPGTRKNRSSGTRKYAKHCIGGEGTPASQR